MKLVFIRNPALRFVSASIVAVSIFFASVALLANKGNEAIASFKEIENTSDYYGEREDTRALVARIDAQISEVFDIIHSETSD